jgi:transposase-like protein
MAIWGRLKQELDRASRAAQGAIDEGRLRLEVFRARQRVDRAAQALGYAVHRARKDGRELPPDELERLHSAIASAEQEVSRLDTQLADLRQSPADSSPTANPPATV